MRPFGEIGPQTGWAEHLDGIEAIVHLAGRADRLMPDEAAADEARAAAALARAAAQAGVRRLVHMSSVRAMGNATMPGAPFRSADPALPRDAYGRGKLAVEHALQAAARQTGLQLVILRPPLVYGPGVKANFRALLQLAASGLPLPLAGIENQRSLIFIDNLVDLTARACVDLGAAGRVLLARDRADFSTPELVRLLAAALDRPARLFAVPRPMLAAFRTLPMLGPVIARLTLSLQLDDAATRAALNWLPPVSPETGLAATARAFRQRP